MRQNQKITSLIGLITQTMNKLTQRMHLKKTKGCIATVSIKSLDSQMLFYPFEKQFYLPTTFIQLSKGQGW